MKKISIILLIAGLFALISCQKQEKGPVISAEPVAPAVSLPAAGSSLIMIKPNADNKVAFAWSAADYGMPLGVLYTIQICKAGTNFAGAVVNVGSVNALVDTLKVSEFNSKLVALEANMEVSNSIDMRVICTVPSSNADTVFSPKININITPYTAKDFIYLVGAFNGWNNTTAPAMNRNMPGLKYEFYINFTAGNLEYKILPTQGSWNGDIGDDKTGTGHLMSDGENNMWVPAAGYYRVNVDLTNMSWSTTAATSWGIIGGFAGNSWGSDVATLTYNTGTGKWEGTFTTTASVDWKFRANAAWSLNYGDNGANGTLEEGGSNITTSDAGTYAVTLDLNPTGNPQAYHYTIVKLP
jgi:starch-binding outer membrane protein SusE/F